MRFKFHNWLSGDGGKQIAFLPHASLYWSEGAYCIAVGWLWFCGEVWWGATEDLV